MRSGEGKTNVGKVDGGHATLGIELVEERERDGVDRVILAVVRQRLLLVVAVLPPVATEEWSINSEHADATCGAHVHSQLEREDNDQQSLDTKRERRSRTYVGVLGHVERHGTVH